MMRLHLFHGRSTPEQVLQGWGPDGPTLERVASLYVTYLSTVRIVFACEQAMREARDATGWPVFDHRRNMLEAPVVEDLIHAPHLGLYFGDWRLE